MNASTTSHPPLGPSDLQRFLDEAGIRARLLRNIGDTPTVPAAAAALGVAPERIVKTLLFLVAQPGQPDAPPRPVVVISCGESRVEKGPLARHFGVGKKRVKLASPEVVLAKLGYPVGGVPPFGHRTRLPVILDQAVVALAEREGGLVYAGGGDDRTMLELTVDELVRVTEPTVLAVS